MSLQFGTVKAVQPGDWVTPPTAITILLDSKEELALKVTKKTIAGRLATTGIIAPMPTCQVKIGDRVRFMLNASNELCLIVNTEVQPVVGTFPDLGDLNRKFDPSGSFIENLKKETADPANWEPGGKFSNGETTMALADRADEELVRLSEVRRASDRSLSFSDALRLVASENPSLRDARNRLRRNIR